MTADQVDPLITSIYRWFDVSGVLLMGIIGGTLARHRGYDIIGFFFIAMLSALGGGMLRDVLINQGTVAAMSQPEYLILAFTGALIARFTYFKGKSWEFLQSHGDALVSALWAATGASKAIQYGLPILPTIMMGVFTATGGGMLRDVVTGGVPSIFGDNQPTVIPAVACSIITLLGSATGHMALGMILGPIVSFALFLIGYYGNWRVSTNPEYAPVNQGAAQVATLAKKAENRSRAVARELEPTRVRSWRHRQMEKALQRRIENEVKKGKRRSTAQHEADDFMQDFTTEFAAIDPSMLEEAGIPQPSYAQEPEQPQEEEGIFDGLGMDFAGDSYDNYDPETHTETGQFEAVDPETLAMHNDMLDTILADDKLTDELIERLAARYAKRDEE